ncbi:hypothetical protein BN1723_020970, partial [Verticillium longisporum]
NIPTAPGARHLRLPVDLGRRRHPSRRRQGLDRCRRPVHRRLVQN